MGHGRSACRGAAALAICAAVVGVALRATGAGAAGSPVLGVQALAAAPDPAARVADDGGSPAPASRAPAGPAAAPAGATAAQVISVTVRGGTMHIEPATAVVTLHREHDGSDLVGSLGPVTVVDARGTLVGWSASATFASDALGAIAVDPGPVAAVTGRPGEATASARTTVDPGGTAQLMSAAPDGGGGTFSQTPRLRLHEAAGGPDTAEVQVTLQVL